MSDARAHLDKAKALLSLPSEESIQYAALELRMCMEVLTYDKLRTYADRVPPELQRRWQPPQAVRALLELEPEADQDFEVHVSAGTVENLADLSNVEWLPLGSHKTPSSKWLGKHYNKVGSLLHEKYPQTESTTYQEANSYLLQVAEDLELTVSGTLWGSPSPINTFVCVECGAVVARNSEELRKGKVARCFSPSCGAEYQPSASPEGEILLRLIVEHPPCSKCKQPMSIKPALLQVGSRMICRNCKQVHQITGRHWQYAPIEI